MASWWRRDDVYLRVFALVIALTFWVLATGDRGGIGGREQIVNRPLEIQGLPEGLVLVDRPDPDRIVMRADLPTTIRGGEDRFRAYLDLGGIGEGVHTIPVQTQAPEGARILEISPAVVRIAIEQELTREIPVAVAVAGEPARGLMVGVPTFEPQQIRAIGPRSRVQTVVQAVSLVDVSGAEQAVVATVPLRPVDERGALVSGVRLEPTQLRVNVPLVRSQLVQVPIRARLEGEPAFGFQITEVEVNPNTASLLPLALAGGQEIPTQIWTEPVDVSGISEDVTLRIPLAIPPGLQLLAPQEVEVGIQVGAGAPSLEQAIEEEERWEDSLEPTE